MERGLVKIKIWLIVLILEIMLINGWINIDEEFVWMGWIKIILKKRLKFVYVIILDIILLYWYWF